MGWKRVGVRGDLSNQVTFKQRCEGTVVTAVQVSEDLECSRQRERKGWVLHSRVSGSTGEEFSQAGWSGGGRIW